MKSLGLIGDDRKPTPELDRLVAADDAARPAALGDLVRRIYEPQLALGQRGTQQQLLKSLRGTNLSGSTIRKAIAFFLAAAKHADVEVSSHFKVPQEVTGEVTNRGRGNRPAGKSKETSPRQPESSGERDKPEPRVPDMSPLISGLVEKLPPPGTTFPEPKREAWITAARAIFDLIYEVGAPTGSGGGAD